ncbi:magnesium transporter [Rubrobacter radiotolerans]|uniref:Magnesium transporter n=1 Tax=Rubrobacter radiotolerans TaxID=42256 RepID=A0AB35T6D7_RUBRA|nr:magnesium transporter [Rubrobacter radiotolerans]MDX5893693.1 magnesium transporter [Rubrobacter radiotolerans]
MAEERKTPAAEVRPSRRERLRGRIEGRPRISPRVLGYLTEEKESLRQGFVALFISSVGELFAGVALASITNTLEELVGLAILIPAAIAMRGAIFGAMGSRISTAIHTGLFELNLRRGALAENVQAAIALSLVSSVFLAVLARYLSGILGIPTALTIVDYVIISTVAGLLAGAILLVITLLVTRLSVRREWDMDNIVAPILTAAGDILTLPALVLATYLIGIPVFSVSFSGVLVLVAGLALYLGLRYGAPGLRRILNESLPILALNGFVVILVGLALEDRLDQFLAFPVLLILLPAFLQEGGALGGILASRLSSKVHLGLIEARPLPQWTAFKDFTLVYIFAVGVFVFIGGASHLIAEGLAATLSPGFLATLGLDGETLSPGFFQMIGLSTLAGLIATTAAVLAAYYGSVTSYRLGLDPDTYGIPIITAAVDLLGFLSLIIALIVFGLAG